MEFKSVTPKNGEYFSLDQAFKRFETETCRTLVIHNVFLNPRRPTASPSLPATTLPGRDGLRIW